MTKNNLACLAGSIIEAKMDEGRGRGRNEWNDGLREVQS